MVAVPIAQQCVVAASQQLNFRVQEMHTCSSSGSAAVLRVPVCHSFTIAHLQHCMHMATRRY